MKKTNVHFFLLPVISMLLVGCGAIDNKAASLSTIYGVVAVISLFLLVGYCCAVKKKDTWYLLLFASVLIVNIGYFALSISRSLDEALLANRLAYLGSVFLPLSMYMIITNVANLGYRKWLTGLLIGIGVVVFLIAASPGYLNIYYKEVTLETINGMTVLNKVYGPLHSIYMIYLFGYFSAMIIIIVYAALKHKIDSLAYAVILAIAVFVNIGVWLIEQFVRIDFEILSISYIISESFLLGLHLLIAENEKQKNLLMQQSPSVAAEEISVTRQTIPQPTSTTAEKDNQELVHIFLAGISNLTPKERALYHCYVTGMKTDVIMEQLCIKENTLKFHSKNLYGKLGVRSRKQLMEIHKIALANNLQVPQ